MTAAVATEPRMFHVGLVDECPIEEVTAGGIRLHKATAKVSVDLRGNTKRDRRPGQVMRLTDSQRAQLVESVNRLAIRKRAAQAASSDSAPGDNGVEWRVILVGFKRELAGYKVTTVDILATDDKGEAVKGSKGETTKIGEEVVRTPQYERRQYETFDRRTDEALAPYVFVEEIKSDPFGVQDRTRLDAPEWAKAFDDKTADVQVVKTGETNTPAPAEQPKRRATRSAE